MATDKRKIAALAIGDVEAPKEVKDSATAMTEATLRFQKAEIQIQLWTKERAIALREISIAEKAFEKSFEEWDPANLKSKDKEEKADV